MQLRSATPDNFEAILALNEESAAYLSPLDSRRLSSLHGMAALQTAGVPLRDGGFGALER